MVFEGSLENINEAIRDAVYRPNEDFNTHNDVDDVIEIEARDMGTGGAEPNIDLHEFYWSREDGVNVYTRKVYIRVDTVNDAPVLIIPGSSHEYVRHGKFEITNVNTLFIEEDEELFIDGVSVVDVDVDYEQALTSHVEFFELIIEVNHGTVTLDTYDMLFGAGYRNAHRTEFGPNSLLGTLAKHKSGSSKSFVQC